MIPRALNAPLSWIGFGKKAVPSDKPMEARSVETLEQHIMDVNVAKSDAEWWAKERIETLQARLDAERKAPGIDWESKFNRAAGDVAALTEQVAEQAAELDNFAQDHRRNEAMMEEAVVKMSEMRAEIAALRPDALLWRAARLKRRGNK